MRGPALDTRPTGIESITPYWIRTSDEDYDPVLATVPKPVMDVNEPTYRIRGARTVVVAGTYIERDSPSSHGQMIVSQEVPDAQPDSIRYQYVRTPLDTNVGEWKAGSTVPSRWRYVEQPNLFGGAFYPAPHEDTRVAIGGYENSPTNVQVSWHPDASLRGLVFDTELSPEQITAVTNWLMAGHYLDAPGTPIGKPELPDGNLNGAGENLVADSHFYSGHHNDWSGIYGGQSVVDDKLIKEYTSEDWAARLERIFSGLEIGETYTLSMRIRTPVELIFRGFLNTTNRDQIEKMGNTPDQWFVASVTFTTTDANVTVRGYTSYAPVGSQSIMDWFKLEKGTEATVWTPAPEDDYDYWQPTRPATEPDTSIWRTYLEVREDGTYRYRIPTRIA